MQSKLQTMLTVVALLVAVAGCGLYFNRTASAQAERAPTPAQIITLDDQFAQVAQLVPSFGGLFFDASGRVNIYLTNPAHLPGVQRALAAVFGDGRLPLADAVAVPAEYNFMRLKYWHDLHRRATLALPGVISADIDERNNLLRVGVRDDQAMAEVRAKLTELGIPLEAVAIVEVALAETQQTLQDKWRPVTGGIQINNQQGGKCTLSFLAVQDNQAGFMTNAHCTAEFGNVDGTVIHQATVVASNVDRIGVEADDPALFTSGACPTRRQCRFSDATFIKRDGTKDQNIPLTEGDFGYLRVADKPDSGHVAKHQIIAKADASFVGEVLDKTGVATGRTRGDVSATCADINQSSNGVDTGRTMLCQNILDAVSDKGDSGAPIFALAAKLSVGPAPVKLHGILWGGDGRQSFFTPINQIMAEFPDLKLTTAEPRASAHEVKIRKPLSNALLTLHNGEAVSFAAEAVDYEDKELRLTWFSSVEGFIGTGANPAFALKTPGVHQIKVLAEDDQGAQQVDEITVTINHWPVPKIISPQQQQTLYKGFFYTFKGEYSDSDEPAPADPCSKLNWTARHESEQVFSPLGNGCNIQAKFNKLGKYTVNLGVQDEFGAISIIVCNIKVIEAPAAPAPIVTILTPQSGALLPSSSNALLKGIANDPGNEGLLFYKWQVQQQQGVWVNLKEGRTLSGQEFSFSWTPVQQLKNGCGSQQVLLRLQVTNVQGKTGQATQPIYVSFPNC